MMIIFIWKNIKIHLKLCKSSIFKIFFSLFIQLYIAKVPIGTGSGSSEIFRIQIRSKGSDLNGSGYATLRLSLLGTVPTIKMPLKPNSVFLG